METKTKKTKKTIYGLAVYDTKWSYFKSLSETSQKPEIMEPVLDGTLITFSFKRNSKLDLTADALKNFKKVSNGEN